MPTTLTVCDTCKRPGWEEGDMNLTDGERLALEIERISEGCEDVSVRRHSCLMGCAHGCNVAVQARNKLSYTLGNFEPTPEAAQALLSYATLHARSEMGQVPYREWPQEVKGHFITRHPPVPSE